MVCNRKAEATLIQTIVIHWNQTGTAEISRMFCARQVFACFKSIEKLGERLVGAVGPYFVAAALSLISVGAVCFCTSSPPPPTSARGSFTELTGGRASRSYMANAILSLDHDTHMFADCIQPIHTLLLRLHDSTWFCRGPTTRNWYRIILVSEKAGA